MNLLVLVKQVPDTSEIRVDPVTNTMLRTEINIEPQTYLVSGNYPSIINPFDAYALELAVRIKDDAPDTKIIVLSVGRSQAQDVLRECLAVGADTAYFVNDEAWLGSDSLAASYLLSQAIRVVEQKEGPLSAVFCGKQAVDGDSGQVGPQVAEYLDYPQVTRAVDIQLTAGNAVVKKETEAGYSVLEVATPCLIAVTKTSFEPRLATLRSKIAARKIPVNILTETELNLDPDKTGPKGSATILIDTFLPPVRQPGVLIQEETLEASASKLLETLYAAKIL